jgi:hypothetical protein
LAIAILALPVLAVNINTGDAEAISRELNGVGMSNAQVFETTASLYLHGAPLSHYKTRRRLRVGTLYIRYGAGTLIVMSGCSGVEI